MKSRIHDFFFRVRLSDQKTESRPHVYMDDFTVMNGRYFSELSFPDQDLMKSRRPLFTEAIMFT